MNENKSDFSNLEFINEVIEYRRKNSTNDTLKKFNLDLDTYKQYLVRSKIDLKFLPCNLDSKAVIDYFNKNKSISKTANHFHVSGFTISRILKDNNLHTGYKKAKPKPALTLEQQKLFDDNLPSIRPILLKRGADWRARKAGMEFDDLYSAGLFALWRTCITFDSSKGYSFLTLLYKAISGEMYEAIELARYGRRCRGKKLIDHSLFTPYEEAYEE
jgi:aryl carrier-like protein